MKEEIPYNSITNKGRSRGPMFGKFPYWTKVVHHQNVPNEGVLACIESTISHNKRYYGKKSGSKSI